MILYPVWDECAPAVDLWQECFEDGVSLEHNISGVHEGRNNQLRGDIIDEAPAADLWREWSDKNVSSCDFNIKLWVDSNNHQILKDTQKLWVFKIVFHFWQIIWRNNIKY